MDFFICTLAVFAITLIVTKSKIMACKREFVEKRYEAAFVGDQRPGWLHIWWHAMWTCPMCLGFWIALVIAPWGHVAWYPIDALALFGGNWLLHCAEAIMFEAGKFFENMVDTEGNSEQ